MPQITARLIGRGAFGLGLGCGAVALVLGVFATVAAAQPAAPPAPVTVSALGPQVGQTVPDFRLTDQTGRQRTRDSIMGPKGAMLVFFRSADW